MFHNVYPREKYLTRIRPFMNPILLKSLQELEDAVSHLY